MTHSYDITWVWNPRERWLGWQEKPVHGFEIVHQHAKAAEKRCEENRTSLARKQASTGALQHKAAVIYMPQ